MAAPTRKTLDSAATIQQSKIVYAKEEEQISKQKGNNKRCREKKQNKKYYPQTTTIHTNMHYIEVRTHM